MAKVQQLNMPAEWQPLIDKIFKWYDNQRYPCWCSKMFISTRASRARSKANSLTQKIADAWATIPDKSGWEAAGVAYESTAYKLFTKDQSYRIKNGLAGVATPSTLHQYTVRKVIVSDNFGLQLATIFRRRHVSSLPVDLSLSIKVEHTSASGRVVILPIITNKVRGYYWPNLELIATIEGNQDWTEYSCQIRRWILDRVGAIGFAIGFENGWEGTIWLDNTKIKEDVIEQYAGWRQNPGTDDWQVIADSAIIEQSLEYVE